MTNSDSAWSSLSQVSLHGCIRYVNAYSTYILSFLVPARQFRRSWPSREIDLSFESTVPSRSREWPAPPLSSLVDNLQCWGPKSMKLEAGSKIYIWGFSFPGSHSKNIEETENGSGRTFKPEKLSKVLNLLKILSRSWRRRQQYIPDQARTTTGRGGKGL